LDEAIKMQQSVFWKVATFIFAIIFGLILWLAYRGELPSFIGGYDKLGHFCLYGAATFFGHRFLRRRHINWWGQSIGLFPLGFTIFTIVEELNQARSPHRTFDWIDLIASSIGIICGYAIAQMGANSRRTNSRRTNSHRNAKLDD
jgi:polysaccharide biosynthesis protein VpsQ